VFPVRFEACVVPRQIQERVQYVDLFPDWNAGVQRAIKAIRVGKRPGSRLVQT
jgi:hypothetical protein